MRLLAVDAESWSQLHDELKARYPSSPWRANKIMRNLRRFPGWRIPTTDEAWNETGGISVTGLSRRLREARAELDRLRALPGLTTADELCVSEERQRMGVVLPHGQATR